MIERATRAASRSRSGCSAMRPSCCRAVRARHPARRGHRPDIGARSGQRLSAGRLDAAQWEERGSATRRGSSRPPRRRCGACRRRCSLPGAPACRRSTTATTSARWHSTWGVADAFDFPGFVPAYIRPLFCRGIGPFRWAALSGDPEDIYRTDARVKELIPGRSRICITGSTWRGERIAFQGLPARICWVGLGERHRLGLAFNEMVARGELEAPVVIGRDHLDPGSVASPNRETEAMHDGSDAVSDWPLLNALLNSAIGGDLGVDPPRRRRRHRLFAARRHGDRLRRHAGGAAKRIERVLWNDPATGVMRHADAGQEAFAKGLAPPPPPNGSPRFPPHHL